MTLSLSWNTYQKNICNGLGLLQQKGEFVDMTIAADGHQVKVHQMVMSLISPYIKELVTSAQCPHPIIFLNRVSFQTLQSILEYAYTGEVLVSRDRLCEFLEACKALHIKGLETESVNTTVGEDLLHFMGAKSVQDPVVPSQTQETECPTHTGVKRRKTDITEEEMETLDDSSDLMDELRLDDALDDIDETISSDKEPEDPKANRKVTPATANSLLQYSLSCQGSIQLVLNRYIYCMRHTRKNNERVWRCTHYNKSQCRAFAVTRDDVVLERGCAHNHPFHDKQILKRLRNGNLYTEFNAIKNVALLNKHQTTINKILTLRDTMK